MEELNPATVFRLRNEDLEARLYVSHRLLNIEGEHIEDLGGVRYGVWPKCSG